jgi:hypothetical protein
VRKALQKATWGCTVHRAALAHDVRINALVVHTPASTCADAAPSDCFVRICRGAFGRGQPPPAQQHITCAAAKHHRLEETILKDLFFAFLCRYFA